MDGLAYGLYSGIQRYEAEVETNMAQANQTIRRVATAHNEAITEIDRLKLALNVEKARVEAHKACVQKLKEELKAVSPKNHYLQYTGRMYREAQVPETGLSPIFNKAFDAKIMSYGMKPLDYRYEAK